MKGLKSLLPNTREVILLLSELEMMKKYTLVGGSALAIYLKHRLSEYLDFFSTDKELDLANLLNQLNLLKGKDIRIINSSKNQLDLFINNVKVTFSVYNWKELNEREPLIGNLYIAKTFLLTVMKVNTLFLRAKFRDYYDLFVINKELYTMDEIYKISKKILPGLTIRLFQNALLFVEDIEKDSIKHLKPKYKVSIGTIERYFEKNIRIWLKSIKL